MKRVALISAAFAVLLLPTPPNAQSLDGELRSLLVNQNVTLRSLDETVQVMMNAGELQVSSK